MLPNHLVPRAVSVVVIVIAALAAGTAAGATTTTATAAKASCGMLHTEGGPSDVTATGVSCAVARKVMKDFARFGAFHNFVGKNHAEGYSIVDGDWHCTLFHGNSSCRRGDAVVDAVPRLGASRPSKPTTLHLPSFLSPDRKVWCVVSSGYSAFCATEGPPPERSAAVDSHGKVSLCFVAQLVYPPGSRVPDVCSVNWDRTSPVLRAGQRTRTGEFSCRSAAQGITCTVTSGAHKGKGFRINKSEAVRVG